MSNFKWDEVDVMAVLEVEPEFNDDSYSYLYVVEKDGLRLEVCIFDYVGDIWIYLYRGGVSEPFIRLPLAQCSEVKRIFSEGGEYLEIIHSQTMGNCDRYSRSIGFNVQLWIKPTIKIELI